MSSQPLNDKKMSILKFCKTDDFSETNLKTLKVFDDKICKYFAKAEEIIDSIVKKPTYTQPGALPYLLFGRQPSTASLYIKIGRNFEKWFKYIVEDCGMELLPDGVVKNVIGQKSKDIDLLFADTVNKIIYYRELKSNIELDTEKLPATYQKVDKIKDYVSTEYPEYKIDFSIMAWAIYEKKDLPSKCKSKIKQCNMNGVSVSYPSDLFNLLGIEFNSETYYDFWLRLGKKIQSV